MRSWLLCSGKAAIAEIAKVAEIDNISLRFVAAIVAEENHTGNEFKLPDSYLFFR